MDAKDWPLRVLRERSAKEWCDNRPVDGPDQAQNPTVKLASIPGKWSTGPGIECLRNEYPTTIDVGGDTHASAVHAYWALATTDETARAAIRQAMTALGAERTVGHAPIRQDWPNLRLTAMHAILRAKFDQHSELADILVATGDARIDYNISSAYWSGGTKCRNWLGRLLELVRSEIVAQRAGFLP
jgi:predicted NAD-dependent protein-ADP-ribosyltransferase YbiA (DUF1768 family)